MFRERARRRFRGGSTPSARIRSCRIRQRSGNVFHSNGGRRRTRDHSARGPSSRNQHQRRCPLLSQHQDHFRALLIMDIQNRITESQT